MKQLIVVAMMIMAALAAFAADNQVAFTPTMGYLSSAGYARLRTYTETGRWEADPLGAMKKGIDAYSPEYGYLSVAGAARIAIYRNTGMWLSPDEALAISDFGDDTYSYWQRMDILVASAE